MLLVEVVVVDVDVRVLEVLETVLDFVWVVLLEVCVELEVV